ncbi:M-phase phosphoprotein 6 [Brevipalpus obovatus]|uniref:M-phase phosphoprotein 6 n=1 Tax=Brevipalpus obovatus TaxID=246614 RepID=UPI003D9EBD91
MGRNKTGLSKNLMQMKFMQRRGNSNDKTAGGTLDGSEISSPFDPFARKYSKMDSCNYQFESSFDIVESLRFGRMSYKGMNPEIERLQNGESSEEDGEVESDGEDGNKVDVTKKEMADFIRKCREKCDESEDEDEDDERKHPPKKKLKTNNNRNGVKH